MEILFGIATVIGGAAAIGYFYEKAARWRAARKEEDSPLQQESLPGPAPEILVPGRIADLIYEGKAGRWSTIVEAYKDSVGKNQLEPDDRLALVVAYDIARARRLVNYDGELVFFDSSWLTHGYGFWSTNPEMIRWLDELTKIAFVRARRGRWTSRAFYWRPNELTSLSELELAKKTIMTHLENGIRVFLVDPIHWPSLVDVQIFTRTDGMISTDFGDFEIEQKLGISEMEPFLHRFEELRDLAARGEALEIPLNTPADEVIRSLVERCPNVSRP